MNNKWHIEAHIIWVIENEPRDKTQQQQQQQHEHNTTAPHSEFDFKLHH